MTQPGIITVGVTKAVQAADLAGMTPNDRALFARMVSEALAEDLKQMVKGARPRSDFRFQVQDAVDDPIQGVIVPMTLQADWALDDLDSDSTAYQTHMKENRR